MTATLESELRLMLDRIVKIPAPPRKGSARRVITMTRVLELQALTLVPVPVSADVYA